eukprot:scaffold436_cov267-Pinguiococcus_pyrenoidosus.AAC.3
MGLGLVAAMASPQDESGEIQPAEELGTGYPGVPQGIHVLEELMHADALREHLQDFVLEVESMCKSSHYQGRRRRESRKEERAHLATNARNDGFRRPIRALEAQRLRKLLRRFGERGLPGAAQHGDVLRAGALGVFSSGRHFSIRHFHEKLLVVDVAVGRP